MDDLHLWATLNRIELGRGREFQLEFYGPPYPKWDVIGRFRIKYTEIDSQYEQFEEEQFSRWWYIERDMDEEAVVKTAWLALTVSDEHARREWFKVDDRRIFSPHNRILILNGKEQKPQGA